MTAQKMIVVDNGCADVVMIKVFISTFMDLGDDRGKVDGDG